MRFPTALPTPTWESGFRNFVMFPKATEMRSAGRWADCFRPVNGQLQAPTLPFLQPNERLNSTAASRLRTPAGNSGWQSVPPAVKMTDLVIRKLDPMQVLAAAKHSGVPARSVDRQIRLDGEEDPVPKTAVMSG